MSLPKLPAARGWSLSPTASLAERARVLLPTGKTLATTNVIISANAYPTSTLPAGAKLEDFITAIQKNDRQQDPQRKVKPAPPLTTKTGQALKAYTFTGGDGAAGETAYGAETSNGVGYFTVFTISARDAVTLSDNIATFRAVMAAYQ